jgi:signal transduction histidine kinase
MAILAEKGEIINKIQHLKKIDGTPFWAKVFNKVNEERTLMQTIVIDRSLQKQYETELESKVEERTGQLTASLKREHAMNEMKSRFVSIASHEFRTPLAAISTSISLIGSYSTDEQEEKRNKHIGRIKSSIRNLTDILNDFLSLDKLEQGKVEVVKETFDLHEFAIDIVEEVNGMLKPGQQVDLSYLGEKEIEQDKKILRHVILNLLSNAIKYSGENKKIGLSIEACPERVRIDVQDRGIGIPAEEQEKLFSQFFRARNAAGIQGTGLGLNIVKRYVELLHGTISFASTPGIGTTFTVGFPPGH